MSRKRPVIKAPALATVSTVSDSLISSPKGWINVFPPKTAEDLAVHTQKRDSIQIWLKMCRPNKSSMLLLTGPPGCGKTACVRVLAEELGYEVNEWLAPLDDEYTKENYQSQKDKFYEFLFKASRYQSLFNQKRRLLLVEDFPNILMDQKSVFHEILGRYKEVGKSPLIFIASETRSKSLNIAYNLFPNDIQAQFSIHNIVLNPISTTLMKKALQTLMGNLKKSPGFKDRFREPSTDVLDSLIVSSQGDIRNAILNLQFVSQKSLPQVTTVRVEETSNKDLNNKKTKRTKDSNKLKEIGRDETISMLHAVGRVLNPKYDASNRLTHSPEAITDAFSTQPGSFLQFLFSNYLPHFATIPESADCAHSLSMSDFLVSEYRDQALPLIALTVGIRGAMVANSAPVSGWHPVKGAKNNKILEGDVEMEYGKFVKGCGSGGIRNLVSKNSYVLDFKGAVGRILGKKAFAIGGNNKEKEKEDSIDLDDEEMNLIQEIEMGDSD